MTVVLQIGDRAVAAEELVHLMAGYQMLPQLFQEILIDQAIAPFSCSDEEQMAGQRRFFEQNQITSDEVLHAWLTRHGMSLEQMQALTTRPLRIEKFKEATWGAKVESYFLTRKDKLDRVIYSLIRTQDMGIAQEIYFRALEGEQTFAELARTYSKGPEAQTDGLIGPVELSVPHPSLGHMLTVSQPGQLWPPTRIGEWIVIVRLEKFIPAQLDEAMRRRLLNEFFNLWLQEQVDQAVAASNALLPSASLPSLPAAAATGSDAVSPEPVAPTAPAVDS